MIERFEAFTVLVAKASRYIRKLKTEEMSDFHLTSGQVSRLYYLYTMGEMTAKELCEVVGEDKGNLSRGLEFLEREGYVEASTEKKYKAPVRLTAKGNAVGEKIHEKISGILLEASEGLSDEERAIFYQSFAKINNNLEKICKKYGG